MVGQPYENVRLVKKCLWLNSNKMVPPPNRRDTIRDGGDIVYCITHWKYGPKPESS